MNKIQAHALNAAARGLLAQHVNKDVGSGWRYAAHTAIEAVSRTFATAPAESETALLALLAHDRLAEFPHHDLFDLAGNLKHLGGASRQVVRQLFEASFGAEPDRGNYESSGAIMPFRFETSDQWKLVRFKLAEYYEALTGDDASLVTELACISWNSVGRRRTNRRLWDGTVLATIKFRCKQCNIVEDFSHVWGRGFEQDENRILSHFEKLLRGWAAQADTERLNAALDQFARCNRTSQLWAALLEAGAEYPNTLGLLLEDVLNEPIFLTHPDYEYGGTALLGALHSSGNVAQRERLEKLIIDLSDRVVSSTDDANHSKSSLIERDQNRLLKALDLSNIVLTEVRDLYLAKEASNELIPNTKPTGPTAAAVAMFDEERLGISLKDPPNAEMQRLRDLLKPFLGRDGKVFDTTEIERRWSLIGQCERAVKRYEEKQPEMAKELWGYLVGTCESIARNASWDKSSTRWKSIRRILLRAAKDMVPEVHDDDDITSPVLKRFGQSKKDEWPSWGWPAPRIDAAMGLPFLAHHLGRADKAIAAALHRLCVDRSHPLRFNLSRRLWRLEQAAPELMWELIDTIIDNEPRFSVLDGLLLSLDWLRRKKVSGVRPRLQRITDRSMQNAPADNHVYETLAGIHLFHFLETGDCQGEAFITSLLAECDSERASHALAAQLHGCREGGWLTATSEAVRGRTWDFFLRVLTASQKTLQEHRATWKRIHEAGQSEANATKIAQEKIERTSSLVGGVAQQLYFASGAFNENRRTDGQRIPLIQLRQFWMESKPLFARLATEPHPHVAHLVIQTLDHLLPAAPAEVFMLAAESIIESSNQGGFHYEALAVQDVVSLIQRVLAEHRDIIQGSTAQESRCLTRLLQVLDLFVDAGWTEARRLTHRLEEIYR